MEKTAISLKSKDGQEFHGQIWQAHQPKAVVCLVHGLGEHIGRYEHVAQAFNAAGYIVIGVDQRGHGKTSGPRGHAPGYNALMDDIQLVLDEAASRFSGKPRFLYGHSLGGSEVSYFLMTRKPKLQGAIITSPGLATGEKVGGGKLLLAKVMSRLNPTFSLANGLDRENLSTEHAVIDAYAADPLVHDRISAALGFGMISSGVWMQAHPEEFPAGVPVLVMQGSLDHLVSPAATRTFAKSIKGDVTYKEYEGLYHELHNESCKDEVIHTMIAWLDAHLQA